MSSVAEIFQTMDYGPAPESAKESLAWLDRHHRKFGHFINGEWTKAKTHFDVMNPATAKTPGQLPGISTGPLSFPAEATTSTPMLVS